MVYSPFECFYKFMAEKKNKSKKKTGITKISKGPNFLKPPPPLRPLGEITLLRLCYVNMNWTLTYNIIQTFAFDFFPVIRKRMR